MRLPAVDLGPDADDRPPRVESIGEELEHRRPPLEHVEQVLTGFELGATCVTEQSRGTTDVELGTVVGDCVDERRPQAAEERALAQRHRRILEPAAQRRRAEAQAGDLLLEIRPGPVDEARVDRLVELEHPLRHTSRRRDDDDDDGARLQLEDVDVAD